MEEEQESEGEKHSSFWNMPLIKKWRFVLFCLANIAYCSSFSLLAPFFPAVALGKGMSETLIGLLFSCYEMCIFLSSPLYGSYMVQIGPRFAFIAGQFFAGGCSVLFGLLHRAPSGSPFIALTFVVRSFMALGASAFSTASFAMAATMFPRHRSLVLVCAVLC
ncbi:hypothetical protein ACOMHN_034431 [Nucella lapillus]